VSCDDGFDVRFWDHQTKRGFIKFFGNRFDLAKKQLSFMPKVRGEKFSEIKTKSKRNMTGNSFRSHALVVATRCKFTIFEIDK
jgi:hypothetical protein